ncbi:MAG: DUF234 domain-containing protein [Candidatus Njordarchaeia archaeon]
MLQKNYRGALYRIKDPFYRFWFRYIFPNQDLIELDKTESLREHISSDLPNHPAYIFEEIARKIVLKIGNSVIKGKEIPQVEKVANWWDRKGVEIDIIGYEGKKIKIIGEVKWRNKPYDSRDLEKTIKTIDLISQRYSVKDYLFRIVSKKGTTKAVKSYVEEKNGLTIDLNDLSMIWDSI